MANPRRRALLWAAVSLAAVWTVAGTAHYFFRRAKVTAEKVAAYLHETDLEKLAEAERGPALQKLSRDMAALPLEERRLARMDESWQKWFASMSDAEKSALIEATLPSGFQQLIASFEQLPEDKRQKLIADALRDLRRERADAASEPGSAVRIDTNAPPLSPDLQQKVVKMGLSAFYAQSSAQTKAELAPVLEEMQRLMESGRLFRTERR